MAYTGKEVEIPMGRGGLHTDDSQSQIPPTNYIVATNVDIFNNQIQKENGSTLYNTTGLDTGAEITAVHDWFPNTTLSTGRLMALTATGKIFRDSGDTTFSSGVAIKTGLNPTTNQSIFVDGGSEAPGDDRKLFLFTGSNQVQVLPGDGTTWADITTPAADWASDYPTFGIIHRDRLWAFGNTNAPHRIYGSAVTDHEEFVTGVLTFEIAPGESESIQSAFVFKGRLFFVKKPLGVYYLDDTDPSTSNWFIRKLEGSWGAASRRSVIVAMNDAFGGNSTGSISAASATEKFGDIESGDVLSILRNEDFMRDFVDRNELSKMHALYYPEKKRGIFTYQGKNSTQIDRYLTLDMSGLGRPDGGSRVVWSQKDNANCLALRRNDDGIERPMYGTNDGFVYLMDQNTSTVGGTIYTSEVQTPHMDLGFLDPGISGKTKHFDFLTVVFDAETASEVTAEVYVDGSLKRRSVYTNNLGVKLGTFLLGTDKLAGFVYRNPRKRIGATGKNVSVKIINNLETGFKINSIIISFRLGDESAFRGD